MKSKAFCSKCRYWRPSKTIYGDCMHPSNVITIKNYFGEKAVPIKSPQKLNCDNTCRNYRYSLVRSVVNWLFADKD